jgi:hypothetical protein
VASVGDLLAFAQTALRGGLAPNGTRILSEASAALMLVETVDLRAVHPAFAGWGLGWFLEDWGDTFVYGHDGGTIGQRAYLRIFPDAGFAIALLTSGGQADGLYRDLLGEAATAIDGSVLGAPLIPGDAAVEAPVGTYASGGMRAVVTTADDGATIALTDLSDVLRTGAEPETQTAALVSSSTPGVWVYTTDDNAGWAQVRPVDGGLYLGVRYLPAVTS